MVLQAIKVIPNRFLSLPVRYLAIAWLAYYGVASGLLLVVDAVVPALHLPAEIILGALGIAVSVVTMAAMFAQTTNNVSRRDRLIVLVLLMVSMVYAIARWTVDDYGLSAKPGDDDSQYLLIAHQIVDLLPGTPLFYRRPPGMPLFIAGILRIAGLYNLWAVSLGQRLLLALIPPLLYVILRDELPRPMAVAGALLFLVTPIHENAPFRAYTEPLTTVSTLLALTAIYVGVRSSGRGRWGWLLGAGIALGWKALVRPTGMLSTAAFALAIILVLSDRSVRHRLGAVLVTVLPTIVALLWLMSYNTRTAAPILNETGPENILMFYAPRVVPIEDSPDKAYFADLLPDVDPDVLFASLGDWRAGRARTYYQDRGDLSEFQAAARALSTQVIRQEPLTYSLYVLEHVYAFGMYPHTELVPTLWRHPELLPTPPEAERPTRETRYGCFEELMVSYAVHETLCAENARVREQSHFEPVRPAPGGPLRAGVHALTVSLTYRLRRLIWPLVWGFTGLIGVFFLLAKQETRHRGWLLGAALAGDMLPILLVAPFDDRLSLVYHPTIYLIGWTLIAQVAARLELGQQ